MKRAYATPVLGLMTIALASCGTTDPPYYAFAITRGLRHDGFIVGIEKRDADRIGAPEKRSDDPRFRFAPGPEGDDAAFEERLDDPEALFVSQIYESVPGPDERYVSHDLWNAHDPNRDGVFDDSLLIKDSDAYDEGYRRLDVFADRLQKKVDQGVHTHVVVMAMGWHNDQIESVARFNAILHRVSEAAGSDSFIPLVVGFTWPSAWGSGSTNPLIEKAGHLGSYFVKTRDADEIGFTIANYVLNRIVLQRVRDLPVVLIGHSFGARLLSRAAFSRAHLQDHTPRRRANLFLGLQAALSVNRFAKGGGGEDSPYSRFAEHETLYVMTSSLSDAANPWARITTGAANAGGWFGLGEARRDPDTYVVPDWAKIKDDPEWTWPDGRVILVDASSIVVGGENDLSVWGRPTSAHNDIVDAQMAELIWYFISRAP